MLHIYPWIVFLIINDRKIRLCTCPYHTLRSNHKEPLLRSKNVLWFYLISAWSERFPLKTYTFIKEDNHLHIQTKKITFNQPCFIPLKGLSGTSLLSLGQPNFRNNLCTFPQLGKSTREIVGY